MEYAVCDLQMLRGKDGEYVLKEFAVFHIAEGAFEHKEATFLPPYPKELIREKYLKQNCYTEAHLHGLGWNAGYSPLRQSAQDTSKHDTGLHMSLCQGDGKTKDPGIPDTLKTNYQCGIPRLPCPQKTTLGVGILPQ